MKKKQLLMVFMVIWTMSLVTTVGAIYSGGISFMLINEGGDTITYINLGTTGEPKVKADYVLVSANQQITVEYGSKVTLNCIVTASRGQPSIVLVNTKDIFHALPTADKGNVLVSQGIYSYQLNVQWSELTASSINMMFRFSGVIDSLTYYTGNTFTFTLIQGAEPVTTTTTTQPTSTTTTPPPDNTIPETGIPPIWLDPEYQTMMRTNYAIIDVIIHIFILPIGIFVIGKKRK